MPRALTLVFVLLAWVGEMSPAAAQTRTSTSGPQSPTVALAAARAAFEYRDFGRVVAILDPWVHPPRITDPDQMMEARRLLGISLHVIGRETRASEEFAQLLLQDPELKLDPFVVPPPVIQTFESVREQMRPLLDEIIKKRRGQRPVEEPVPLGTHPLAAYAPFGLSHFIVLDSPGWGALWLTLQLVGLGANIGGYFAARGLRTEVTDAEGNVTDIYLSDPAKPDFNRATGIQFAGIGFFALSWLASSIHGHLLLERRNERSQGISPVTLRAGVSGVSVSLAY